MTASVRQLKRKAAKRPVTRTIRFVAPDDSEYAGWEVEAKADFPAGILVGLQSGQITDIIASLDRIVIDHNMPNDQDEIAASMGEVDPYDGLLVMSAGIFEALAKLPNR